MKNILFSLLIALNLVSCSNNDDNNQNQNPYLAILPVNINLNLNLPEYSALKFPGNSIIYLYCRSSLMHLVLLKTGKPP